MPKKNTRNTKGKIISAAWKLFYENGYDATTIEDIIYASGTSRGSFYHYFEGKDALLGTLAYVFDEKYEQLRKKYTHAQPFTKESLLYREIFEKYYAGQGEMIVDFWMPNKNWEGCNVNDPSARVLSNYGESGK